MNVGLKTNNLLLARHSGPNICQTSCPFAVQPKIRIISYRRKHLFNYAPKSAPRNEMLCWKSLPKAVAGTDCSHILLQTKQHNSKMTLNTNELSFTCMSPMSAINSLTKLLRQNHSRMVSNHEDSVCQMHHFSVLDLQHSEIPQSTHAKPKCSTEHFNFKDVRHYPGNCIAYMATEQRLHENDTFHPKCSPQMQQAHTLGLAGVTCSQDPELWPSYDTVQVNCTPTPEDPTRGASGEEQKNDESGLPDEAKLHRVFQNISDTLPRFFDSKPNIDFWKHHSPDIVFIDNIRHKKPIRGLNRYALCSMWIRFGAHMKFGYIKFDILQMTKHASEGTVRVRWRVRGLPGMKLLYNFWKFRIWMSSEEMREHEVWIDGFSTFFVNTHGLIVKHVADKVIPESNEQGPEKSLAEKLKLGIAMMSKT